MSLENLPESERATWLEARDQVAGLIVHIGQKMFDANEGAKSGDSGKPGPRRIALTAKESGIIDIAYHLPYDASGLAEAWSARTAIESSTGLRFLSDRIAPGRGSSAQNVIAMTMTVPEPDDAESLSAVLKETLSEFCLKDIEVSIDGESIEPVWDGWERGMVRGNGHNYSIAMCNGIPVCRTEIAEDAPPESGVIWFTTSNKDAFTPASPHVLREMAASLSQIPAPTVSPGSGAIQTHGDSLSLEARLMSWGLSSMREVTSEWLSSLSPDDMTKFLSSVVSGETAYQLPDIHVLDRALPAGHLSEEMNAFIDMWGGAARQAAKAAGIESVRIGMCRGLSSWTRAADGAPVLYVDPDVAKNWTNQEMLSEAIYMMSGLREQEARALGQKFDRARDVSDMFAKADRDDDAYIALRKDLRSKMGQAAIVLRDGIPDEAAVVPGLSDRLLQWAWPEQEIAPQVPAGDVCEAATILPLPEPEAVQEPVPIHAARPSPVIESTPQDAIEPAVSIPQTPPTNATNGRTEATNGRIETTIGRIEDAPDSDENATNGHIEATNGRIETTNGRIEPSESTHQERRENTEEPQNTAEIPGADVPGDDWLSDDFFAPDESAASEPVSLAEGSVAEPIAPEAETGQNENSLNASDVQPDDSGVQRPAPRPAPRPVTPKRPKPVRLSPAVVETPVETAPIQNQDEIIPQSGQSDLLIGDDFFADGVEAAPEQNPDPVGTGITGDFDMSFFDTEGLLGDFSSEKIAERTSEPSPEASAKIDTPQIRPVPVRLTPKRLSPDQMS